MVGLGIACDRSPQSQKHTVVVSETTQDEGRIMHTRSEWMAAIGFLGLLLAYEPTQSTGPGIHQDENADTRSKPGASVDSKSSKNEDSGSATGAARDRSRTGMESGNTHGSDRPDETGRSMRESGAGTTGGGASRSRK